MNPNPFEKREDDEDPPDRRRLRRVADVRDLCNRIGSAKNADIAAGGQFEDVSMTYLMGAHAALCWALGGDDEMFDEGPK